MVITFKLYYNLRIVLISYRIEGDQPPVLAALIIYAAAVNYY